MSPRILFALAAVLLIPSCDDPSIIFGGGWPPPSGGPTGSLGSEAFLPDDGEWVLPGAPVVDAFLPTGTSVHSASPIVVRFSESMSAETMAGALVLKQVGGFVPIPITASRVGDGRLYVVIPAIDLLAGETYTLEVDANSAPTDMTGQVLATGGVLGQFTVATTDPAVPKVVATWPVNGALGMSAIGEITTIFDRPMDATSFTADSFAITVDSTPPAIDPDPSPLEIVVGFFPTTDTRVWRWISQNADGVRQDLGADAAVELSLSPAGNQLSDADGGILPTSVVAFQTAAVSVPDAASLTSAPFDAIGIAKLTSGSGVELAVTVDIPGGLAGDVVGLFLFGLSKLDGGLPGPLVAYERSKTLTVDSGTATFTLAELDIVASSSPLSALFADGDLGLVFYMKRGSVVTPVRNLDVDAIASGIQDPVLDTVAPELLAIFGEDAFGVVVSDQRGLQLAGLASEELRAAEITTSLGSNGSAAPVLGAREDGSFLSAAVAGVDVIDPVLLPLDWTLVVFDRALNPLAVPRTGTFVQRGVVGPVALGSGGNLDVEVFDAETLAPIVGARVLTHRDDGATYPLVASGSTGSAGTSTLATNPAGATIVTIVATGYDLFSLVGVESTRLSVPLRPTTPTFGDISGTVFAGSDLANFTLGSLARRFDDSRRVPENAGPFAGENCVSNPFGGGDLDCPFGPEPLRSGRLGALSLIAGNFLLPQGAYSASASLQAFALSLPLAPLDDLEMQTNDFTVTLLNEPGVDVLDLATELPTVTLDAAGLVGVDLGNLVGDASTMGDPIVTAETVVAGTPGSVAVGLGVAYDQGGDVWTLRLAVPGAVLPGGDLADTVDTDLYYTAEVRDTAGASSARRVRSSDLPGLATPLQLDLVDAPEVTSPLAGASTGSAVYDVAFDNVLPDALGPDGLFVVELTGPLGRRWRLVGRDLADGVAPVVHLVNLAAEGETGLAAGSVSARALALGGAGLGLDDFLWSDLERSFETSAAGPPVSFNAP